LGIRCVEWSWLDGISKRSIEAWTVWEECVREIHLEHGRIHERDWEIRSWREIRGWSGRVLQETGDGVGRREGKEYRNTWCSNVHKD
jgi:hypothetical protein